MPTDRHDRLLYRLIGERVKKFRRGKLTQEQLADLVSVARSSITNLENGRQRVPLHQIMRVASALGCELRDLMPTMAEMGLSQSGAEAFRDDVQIVGEVTPAVRLFLSRYSRS